MRDFAAFFMEQAQVHAHVQFVYDLTARRVVFVNEAYEGELGGTPARVNEELPALLGRLYPEDQQFLAACWRLWTQGELREEVEFRLLGALPEDPCQWWCLSSSHHPNPKGPGWVSGTLRDISVAKRHQQQVETYSTRKNFVLDVLSHDLSGTLAVTQQIAQYLRQELPGEGSRIPELLRVLETSSEQGRKMIRDLLEVEFLESANGELKRDRVELGAILRQPLAELQQRQGLLGHQFTYELPTEPVYVELDVTKFGQVVQNLVSNALKFTPDGKLVRVRVEPVPDAVYLYVEDEGIGIPAALQPHLFERFTPARRPGLRGEPTTGLGLMLCKTVVEWHHGTISVSSTEGQGTTFTVQLPQARRPAGRDNISTTGPQTR